MSRRKKKIIEVEIIDMIFPNKSIGELEGKKIVMKGGIKGQKVKVVLGRKRKDYIEGKILEVLESSPMEINIGCPHHGVCGGCTYQTLTYEEELKLKEEQILRLFQDNGLEDINFLGVEQSDNIKAYRNKMEYTFGDEKKDGPLALGLHRRGKYYEVVNVDGCNIVDGDFTRIRNSVLKYFQDLNTPYYNKRTHEGFLRHLVIRKALSTGEILINLVTSSQSDLDVQSFVDTILRENQLYLGKVCGILHSVNDGLGDTVRADEMNLLYGRDYIVEEILGLRFQISPFSFFQTNTFGAEKLYSIVRDFAGDIDDKVVFDLYSGTGTIAQIMAPVARKVIGIEIVEEAVEKAKENAKLNELTNVEFIAGDVLKAVDELTERPDLIVIDPPRDGIHPKAIDKIIDFNPETFVYVSCNPVTLVRDLKVFNDRGYRIEKLKCMDMFHRTPHVESIVLMHFKGNFSSSLSKL